MILHRFTDLTAGKAVPSRIKSGTGDLQAGVVGLDHLHNPVNRLSGPLRVVVIATDDRTDDLSMFAHAGTRVAFCAKEVLKKEANIIIEKKDLTEILGRIF